MIHMAADRLAKPQSKPEPGKKTWKRWLLVFAGLVLAIPFLPEMYHVILGSNFHTVIEKEFYRAAQPSGASLEKIIHQFGIRTVINLRGPNTGEDWFDEEEKMALGSGVLFKSVNMSASDKPQDPELRNLIDNFDRCPLPILVHCNSGSDRSGFASACYLLLKTNASLEEARGQLSIRYGHFPWGKAGCQSQVLDQYAAWLQSQNLIHHPDHFRRWAREIYQKDDWPDGAGPGKLNKSS